MSQLKAMLLEYFIIFLIRLLVKIIIIEFLGPSPQKPPRGRLGGFGGPEDFGDVNTEVIFLELQSSITQQV